MRRERAPIEDSTASTSAGSALRSASVTSSVGDAVEQRDARLLREQQNILEREQPRADERRDRRAPDASRSCMTSSSCDLSSSLSTLATRFWPAEMSLRRAFDQQPRPDLVLDDPDRRLGNLGHGQHALDDLAARRFLERQQHIGGGLRRQLGQHQRRRLRVLVGEERAEPRRLELFDRRPDRRRRVRRPPAGFSTPISAFISSGDSDSLSIVSILSAESSSPAPSVNSASNSATIFSSSLCGMVRSILRRVDQRLAALPA